MNTETGKNRSKNAHDFMVTFLSQFYAEWDGEVIEQVAVFSSVQFRL